MKKVLVDRSAPADGRVIGYLPAELRGDSIPDGNSHAGVLRAARHDLKGVQFEVGVDMHGDKFQSRPTPRLATLISIHKACFVRLRERTISAFENEMNARSRIIAYEPRDRREALERLSYLFAVVATANNWLDDDEMEEFLAMIRDL